MKNLTLFTFIILFFSYCASEEGGPSHQNNSYDYSKGENYTEGSDIDPEQSILHTQNKFKENNRYSIPNNQIDYEYKLRAKYCGDSLSNWSIISSFTTGIGGCLDSSALNYDPIVTDDNGSCIYPVGGCLDSSASNYDSDLDQTWKRERRTILKYLNRYEKF